MSVGGDKVREGGPRTPGGLGRPLRCHGGARRVQLLAGRSPGSGGCRLRWDWPDYSRRVWQGKDDFTLYFSIVTRINNHVDGIILEWLPRRNVSVTTMRRLQRAARLSRVVEWRWRGIVSVLLRMLKKTAVLKLQNHPWRNEQWLHVVWWHD